MHYAFSFVSLIYILNCYYSSVSLSDLYFPLTHLSQERNLYLVLLFSLKNEDFCIFTSAISSPSSKDTIFYLYYIANAERVYTYDFLFILLLALLLAVMYLLLLTRNLLYLHYLFKKSLS